MNVPYSEQLQSKNDEIRGVFSELIAQSFLSEDSIEPILDSNEIYHYRDKVTSPFVDSHKVLKGKASKGKKDVYTGIYAKNTHLVVPVKDCLLENPVASKIVESVRQIMQRHGIEPYDEDAGVGFIRHVVVRVGHKTNEVLVTLVTNSDDFPHSKSFCKELRAKVPEITSIVQNVNKRQTNVILGDKFKTLYGPGFILDELCGLTFRISPGAFYQVNSAQTENLYNKAVEMASLEAGDSIIDAYCGTGTIGLVANRAYSNPLLGLDSSNAAISDAKMNAKHNGASNAVFIAEDATKFMEELASGKIVKSAKSFDLKNLVVFLDPPRSGATEEFLKALIGIAPKKIVYISCNPKTQARDCEILCKAGYDFVSLQPVDMFPHTPHIESIALLEKRSRH